MGVVHWRRAVAAGLLLVSATAATASATDRAPGPLPAAPPFAMFEPENGGPWTLALLDPVTLAPRAPSLAVGEFHGSASPSPDHSQIAIGRAAGGPASGIGIVIAARSPLRQVTGIRTPIAVSAVQWLAPRRVVAFLQNGLAMIADPVTGAVIRTTDARTCSADRHFAQTRHALVVLDSGGHAVAIDKAGRVRKVALPGIASPCGATLAYDFSRDRVLIGGTGAGMYSVDMRTLRASSHRLSGPSLRGGGRLVWAGPGFVAVAHRTANGHAAGVELIDTRTWTRRTIDAQADGVAIDGDELLVYNGAPRGTGIGVREYDRSGRRRLAALARQHVSTVAVTGRYAYALGPGGVRILDLALRETVSSTPGGPFSMQLL